MGASEKTAQESDRRNNTLQHGKASHEATSQCMKRSSILLAIRGIFKED